MPPNPPPPATSSPESAEKSDPALAWLLLPALGVPLASFGIALWAGLDSNAAPLALGGLLAALALLVGAALGATPRRSNVAQLARVGAWVVGLALTPVAVGATVGFDALVSGPTIIASLLVLGALLGRAVVPLAGAGVTALVAIMLAGAASTSHFWLSDSYALARDDRKAQLKSLVVWSNPVATWSAAAVGVNVFGLHGLYMGQLSRFANEVQDDEHAPWWAYGACGCLALATHGALDLAARRRRPSGL